ncbi:MULTISPECIES: DUF3316 domain-containing protein [Vibrio]|uniref:DUF3316 domain-containing protein n=1 Tax=Vibrio TaxID=662 RepID=UPI0003C7C363|nr:MULTISPECIES: DUF3316 domain-containing protein [Vibrio]EIU6805774.1 DUF3316 domain-containing protein [Vibrio parahaemolyticus]EJG0732065.1 DUF3316 domain-containing protein [Vibrio parahaemolyticus]EJG0787462.1 DUF3316 domain-containing protein [Vibrio parahaemolyticus]EJG0881137.1 DUF3316 domain-containing protein [Vibrio parahaemolyticus]ELA8096747.1 DUF3316 domain-containing protein [Vibrio parahaemolyticus]
MNAIKTALFVTVMAMTSASAFAQPLFAGGNYVSREEMKTISVTPMATSDEAYQQALSELNSLKTMSARELNKELNILTFNVKSRSTHLKDGGFVTVQERMNEDGQLEYLGKVNVKVHYAERDNNR